MSTRNGTTEHGLENSSLGGRVRSARDRLGWTRETLAHHCALSWSAIEQIESGRRRNTRPDTLRALSEALGVTIDYLVSGQRPSAMLSHQVLVYGDDDGFVNAAAPYLSEGMERAEALLVTTTAKKIGLLKDELGDSADQVEFFAAETWYASPVSAMNAYRLFLDDQVAEGAPWVRVVGDPEWPGRSEEDVRAWNQYESLVNLTFSPSPVTLLCTYDERTVHPSIVTAAQLTHPQIVEGGEVSDNPLYRDPSEFFLGEI